MSRRLRKDLEGRDVSRADDAEVATIERGDRSDAQPLRGSDDGGIDRTQREVAVLRNKLRDPKPVARADGLGREGAAREVAQEADLRLHSEARTEEVAHLGDDEEGNDERAGMGAQKFEAGFVMAVVFVDVGVQRTGVYDQRYRRASVRRISSTRSAMSWCPLRPAFAARSRLRPR